LIAALKALRHPKANRVVPPKSKCNRQPTISSRNGLP